MTVWVCMLVHGGELSGGARGVDYPAVLGNKVLHNVGNCTSLDSMVS